MIDLLVSFMLTPPGIGCTMENPYPVVINSVCTGYGYPGSSCKLSSPTCSSIPGQPGTWNPNGYTPKGYWNE